ncbi:minor capsid protein [Clostridium neuense]|uniref:Minor capsid protein n=1 Tax=Clostridium neuense TaxID=1728934 RepID=A0ABW8TGF1_9CLOT
MAKVNPEYRAAIEQIKIDADNYADQQMQTTYKNQKDHLTELHKFIGLMYIKYAVEGLLNKLTLQQRKSIIGDVDSTLKAMAKDMGQTQVDNVTNILKHNYSDTYYKNAYVMDSGLKVDLKFDILKDEYINAAVNNPIDGEIFSKRIWDNTADVADKLKQSIIDAMNSDTTIDAIGKDIQEIFNVNAYNAQRLVNTENARVQSQAIDDIAASTGVKKQIYSATLDNKTSEECAALDGHLFDVDDPDKVVPPENHPNCRCVLINVPFDDWQPSVRKDNDSKEVIDYTDYNNWLKDKGIGDDE